MEMWPHDSLTLMFAGCESRDDERGSTFSLFTVLRSSLSHSAFAVTLLFGVLLGDLMLIPNAIMPDTVRFSHDVCFPACCYIVMMV